MDKIEILRQLKHEYSVKRDYAENKAELILATVLKNEDFKNINKKITDIKLEIAKDEFENKNANKKRTNLQQLEIEQEKILNSMNFTASDLKPQYTCKKCEDTGFFAGNPCDCFNDALRNKLIQISNINFDNFSSFTNADFTIQDKDSVENTKLCFKSMEEFCNKFPNTNKKNVIISGDTGTGKTYLVQCIATELIKKNYFVYFTSSFNLNNIFLKYHTQNASDRYGLFEPLLECDCLIIDDLGTENILNNVTVEYLLSIINERTINSKHTIISTNLSPKQFLTRYGERLFSRVFNKATRVVINLFGKDIRIKRNY